MKVSYTTRNIIGRLLSQRPTPNQNKFDCSGVYQLTCPDCMMKYVGQRGSHYEQGFLNTFWRMGTPLDR